MEDGQSAAEFYHSFHDKNMSQVATSTKHSASNWGFTGALLLYFLKTWWLHFPVSALSLVHIIHNISSYLKEPECVMKSQCSVLNILNSFLD